MKIFLTVMVAVIAICFEVPASARYTKVEPCRPGENSVTKLNELVIRRCTPQTPEQIAKELDLTAKLLKPIGKTDSQLKPLTTPAPNYDIYRKKYEENLKRD